MENIKRIQKIGSILLLWGQIAWGATGSGVQFSAQVDQGKISLDETVSLSLIVKSDSSVRLGEPQFNAHGLQVVHEFSSVSISSQYDSNSGHFTTVNQHQITKVLRPDKVGTFKITGIQLNVGGKVYPAPDITVQVVPGGGKGTSQAPRAPGHGMNSNGRRVQGEQFMVRAEIDKDTAYKGEQVIVSYYLYHQMKVFNIQVSKFPILSKFLREDLEIPVMGQRLESEPVMLKGVPYERALLARYAAYPLQEGKLDIDSMAIKFNYYSTPKNDPFDDEENPFFGFFPQLAPKATGGKSDMLSLKVNNLPEAGKPASFTGGVGNFNVTSAIDKYEVHMNDPLTLTVKIEGQGNVATMSEPKTQWPDQIELYESKGRSLTAKGGVGEKVFEYLLIPRASGTFTLPRLEYGFFDPIKKEYYTKSIEPIQVTVLDPRPGSAPAPVQPNPGAPKAEPTHATEKAPQLKSLKPPLARDSRLISWQPAWRLLYWAFSLALAFLVGIIGLDVVKGRKNRNRLKSVSSQKKWESLHQVAQESQGAAWQSVTQAYDLMTNLVLEEFESTFQISAKSVSREQLRQWLVEEKGMPASTWERSAKLFEFADLVRFASSVGGVSESSARGELQRWVNEAEAIVQSLESPALLAGYYQPS
jgi:hypothetical protein